MVILCLQTNGDTMNQLKVNSFHSADISNLTAFSSRNNEDIYFPLEFEVEAKDGSACSIFSVVVATPQSLKKHDKKPQAEKTKYLIVHCYNWAEIQSRIYHILQTTPCSDGDLTPLLAYFNWEYEGYH